MSRYVEMLKDPRWQRMRLVVFQRDQWTCLRCKDTTQTLHVHHTFYARGRAPWEYHPDSLLTLCATCHEAVSLDPEAIYPAPCEGVANVEERTAILAALARYQAAAPTDDGDVLAEMLNAVREARQRTFDRVRAPYTPEWA